MAVVCDLGFRTIYEVLECGLVYNILDNLAGIGCIVLKICKFQCYAILALKCLYSHALFKRVLEVNGKN